jgi:rRNA processing protein Krr1/Pno1
MNSSITRIIPQYPGYYQRYFPDGSFVLEWVPVPSYYSPPNLHHGICVKQIQVDTQVEKGLIIGKQGKHFKRITESTGCLYIFLKQEYIEIWGSEQAVQQAQKEIEAHLNALHKQSIFCPHETNDLCSSCRDCSTCRMIAHCYGCNKCATCNPQSLGYCKGCGGCQSCAPVLVQGFCEDCFILEDYKQDLSYIEFFRQNYDPICYQTQLDEPKDCGGCAGIGSH